MRFDAGVLTGRVPPFVDLEGADGVVCAEAAPQRLSRTPPIREKGVDFMTRGTVDRSIYGIWGSRYNGARNYGRVLAISTESPREGSLLVR